jgi:hypothetical protein
MAVTALTLMGQAVVMPLTMTVWLALGVAGVVVLVASLGLLLDRDMASAVAAVAAILVVAVAAPVTTLKLVAAVAAVGVVPTTTPLTFLL